MNFYAYVTVKNINFKEYISYYFIGNDNMINELQGASIFLIGKPNIVYEEVFYETNKTGSVYDRQIRERHEEFLPDALVSDVDL